jgi:carbamoyltransferase
MNKGYILGISCGFHDSAASLIKDGTILGACEEERFTGIKHDSTFPINTIKWLMETYNVKPDTLDAICFYENPKNKLDRIKVSTEKKPKKWYEIFNKKNNILIRNQEAYETLQTQLKNLCGKNTKIHYTDHHQSHLAYSYYTSNFEESAILSVDGVGEWETTVLGIGTKNKIKKLNSINFPHSLGMLYSAFTAFLGFKPNEGEYKVMGLAPYGNPKPYNKLFKELYTVKKNGSFELNMEYFTYEYSNTHMFNEKLGKLFGFPNRLPEDKLEQHHKDLAATLQYNYENLFFGLLNELQNKTQSKNICLSGGCAYNGTANGKILKRTRFKNLYIPPAPSDAGSAIGCGLDYYYKSNNTRVQNINPYLGPSYNKTQILETLEKYKDFIWIETKLYEQIIDIVADEIVDGNVVGWFQGRMEFGARALGNRSILANPRDPQMKSRLNKMIKKREGFRPFAPIVKEDSSLEYFDYQDKVPYMNQVVKVKSAHAKNLPAITHIDNSARIQTLNKHQHRYIYSLLEKLEEVNKYPIVINTSFNLKDQTMVLTPEDAIKTFLNCEMDTLILHNHIIKKKIL